MPLQRLNSPSAPWLVFLLLVTVGLACNLPLGRDNAAPEPAGTVPPIGPIWTVTPGPPESPAIDAPEVTGTVGSDAGDRSPGELPATLLPSPSRTAQAPSVTPTPSPTRSGPVGPSAITVRIVGGDSREADPPPDVVAMADPAQQADPPPKAIEISYGAGTTAWNGGRVLWAEGDWVAATTERPFSAIGVQFYGDSTIGWARVLFDGHEVWRGDTAGLWSDGTRWANYVEVAGFGPGPHTIQAECLGIEGAGGGLSVPVPFFGFSLRGGVGLGR